MWGTPEFVVTGTGRCGTAFTARLFTAAGVKCGHEEWFRPMLGVTTGQRPKFRNLLTALRFERWRRSKQLVGESSWMAVPYLDYFGGRVFLQLREPVAVIDSLLAIGHFTDFTSTAKRDYHLFAAEHFDIQGPAVVDAMRWWIEWNRRAESHADLVYKIEDLDGELFAQLLDDLGIAAPDQRAIAALESTSTTINSSKRRGNELQGLDWGDLPDCSVKERLQREAARHGYGPYYDTL